MQSLENASDLSSGACTTLLYVLKRLSTQMKLEFSPALILELKKLTKSPLMVNVEYAVDLLARNPDESVIELLASNAVGTASYDPSAAFIIARVMRLRPGQNFNQDLLDLVADSAVEFLAAKEVPDEVRPL